MPITVDMEQNNLLLILDLDRSRSHSPIPKGGTSVVRCDIPYPALLKSKLNWIRISFASLEIIRHITMDSVIYNIVLSDVCL